MQPYATSGKGNVSIDVDDTISKKLAVYWGGLAQEGVIGVEPDFTEVAPACQSRPCQAAASLPARLVR
ncbi:hypothetical protein OG806_45705 [Streptomyces sp. NBC_00882]|uniref:hypothetical protein n=1 Tax=Streptomyces TaxID=1883 RepID=UPI0038653C45|nr:hypothetical protein OH837_03680 [Streptomyces canus]WSZ37407.1 hypothetical protein OG806_45705 [Streptomyces sp. NBC_00882]WSZ64313.1 hypothetical protein OH824_44570 [Streptomyces canus]